MFNPKSGGLYKVGDVVRVVAGGFDRDGNRPRGVGLTHYHREGDLVEVTVVTDGFITGTYGVTYRYDGVMMLREQSHPHPSRYFLPVGQEVEDVQS